MIASDPLAVADRLSASLGEAGIAHHFGGSLASSVYGFFRTTNDLDLVVAVDFADLDRFVETLSADFLVDPEPLRDAARLRDCANVFHRQTLIKVDVFFALDRPFAREEMARSVRRQIGSSPPLFASLLSPEDVVLHKLEWYRDGGRTSERQWNDVLGVIKVQADALDRGYLAKWAEEIGVPDLLDRAFRESGVPLRFG